MRSGEPRFRAEDLDELSALVADTWTAAAELDWSVSAAGLDWSCLHTADHAVDCVYAPAFFLASRNTEAYPEIGGDLTLGPAATPERLVQSLRIATRLLIGVVNDAPDGVRAILFRRPKVELGAPGDFVPRAAVELILHSHDVSAGLGVPFDPPADLCVRLREHTRPWPVWTVAWNGLPETSDPWDDLLRGSGRRPT